MMSFGEDSPHIGTAEYEDHMKQNDLERSVERSPWILTRTLWPKKCWESGKRIPMGSKAYLQSTEVYRNGQWLKHERWITEQEYLVLKLRSKM